MCAQRWWLERQPRGTRCSHPCQSGTNATRLLLTPPPPPPRVCRAQTKHRTHVDESKVKDDKVPRTFVIKRGRTDATVVDLVENLKKVMAPYTALKLRSRK